MEVLCRMEGWKDYGGWKLGRIMEDGRLEGLCRMERRLNDMILVYRPCSIKSEERRMCRTGGHLYFFHGFNKYSKLYKLLKYSLDYFIFIFNSYLCIHTILNFNFFIDIPRYF